MKKKDYTELFKFPDIPWQNYPVYSISEAGNIFNLKSILYPSPKSRKKFTRRKHLIYRSLQEKIFDSLINIGYWQPLIVVREFPVIIMNDLRLPGQSGGFYMIDYFFPTVLEGRGLFLELDSELHDRSKDELRDSYLRDRLGVETFRLSHFEKESTQKGEFHNLTRLIRSKPASEIPRTFDFKLRRP